MTAPVWMASPPEVHSALLSTGPGPGSLLAAAGAWSALSAEYASAAAELGGLLGAAQAGAWQGPSAEQYVAAHAPYLAWLQQASADSAGVAAQHEVAAAAYTGALAAMPTLVELAANHVIHGVLVATNFFGINTIPIALNEADYVRMWVQAAITMGAYQAASGGALASAPRTTPAPNIVDPGVGEANSAAMAFDPGLLLSQSLQTYINFYGGIFNELATFFQNPIGNSVQLVEAFMTNPSEALVAYGPLLFALGYEVFFNLVGWPTWGMLLSSPFLLPLSLSLGISAVTLLPTGIAPVAVGAVAAGVPALASTASAVWPVAGMAPTVATPAAAPASAAPVGAGMPAPAPAAASGTFGYLVAFAGGIGPESGPTLGGRGGAKAPAATIPAVGAAAPVRAEARARRRRRAAMREYGDEFLDMDSDVGVGVALEYDELVSAVASGSGAGRLGFAGTAHRDAAVGAAGLTKLAGDDFGGGPRVPMVPGTWDREGPGESGRGGDDGS
jgi:PPE-repeat protein